MGKRGNSEMDLPSAEFGGEDIWLLPLVARVSVFEVKDRSEAYLLPCQFSLRSHHRADVAIRRGSFVTEQRQMPVVIVNAP